MQLEFNLNITPPPDEFFLMYKIDELYESHHKVRKKLFAANNQLLKRCLEYEDRIEKLEKLVNGMIGKEHGESWEYNKENKLFELKEDIA